MMIRIFPFIFVLLWSSAFITTKPIIDNSDPFAALAFRFALVAFGFFLFSIYTKQKILVSKKNFFESFFSGVLFHGFYLGGVFYSIELLSEFWQGVSKINPILYMVNSFRYGMIGISDISVDYAILIICLFIIIFSIFVYVLLKRGIGIRT